MKKSRIVQPSAITQNTYSDRSAAQRNVDVGAFHKAVGLINIAAKRICLSVDQSNVPVTFYNQTSATVFVAFGSKDVVAPIDGSTGFPILAGEKCTVNSGPNTHAATSSVAGIFAYTAPEEDERKEAT